MSKFPHASHARMQVSSCLAKARSSDYSYVGTGVGEVGTVEVKGLMFGNFRDCSEAAHALISSMATRRVNMVMPGLEG